MLKALIRSRTGETLQGWETIRLYCATKARAIYCEKPCQNVSLLWDFLFEMVTVFFTDDPSLFAVIDSNRSDVSSDMKYIYSRGFILLQI